MARPAAASEPVFRERLTGRFAPEARFLALPVLALAGVLAFTGAGGWALAIGALGVFSAAFFRNPERHVPGDDTSVVSPADGRVIEVGEIETPEGEKALRIGIFLSVFDVHVNRCPVAGRVRALERGGEAYLAAFNRQAETRNVRLTMTLETAAGETVRVVQITGLVARRIVCHAEIGEWVPRGARYGLIRFGSRTDVVLPPRAQPRVKPGDRVRGGSSIVARLPERPA